MSELHWTGAAVLLALAVLGGGNARPRRPKFLSWAEFAREHDLNTEQRRVPGEALGLAAMPVRNGQPYDARRRRAS